MKNLWLFDIDGTLVNINKLHLANYREIYLKHGIAVSDSLILSTFGMTENEMHKKIFNKLRLPCNEELIKRLNQEHVKGVLKSLNSLNAIKPLGSVLEFLSYLKNNKEYAGVVTGNLKETAEVILNKSGLDGFFSFVCCDDGKKSRKQIIKEAVKKAKSRNYDFKKVIVIGDTIHDIAAGKHANAFTVGVATGSDTLSRLRKAKPDVAVNNLKNFMVILKTLNES